MTPCRTRRNKRNETARHIFENDNAGSTIRAAAGGDIGLPSQAGVSNRGRRGDTNRRGFIESRPNLAGSPLRFGNVEGYYDLDTGKVEWTAK